MSGGQFSYGQYSIGHIASEIEDIINKNVTTEGSDHYPDYIIQELKIAVELLKKSEIYVQRIDRLVSGDDGDETFIERLADDLNKNEYPFINKNGVLYKIPTTDE